MFAERPRFKNWVYVVAICGFVFFALYLFFFGDLGQISSIIGQVSIPLYSLAFICVLGSALFNALTWQDILCALSVKTKFSRVFSLSWVGTFVDAMIPGAITGDVFKAYLLSKDEGVDGAKTAASIVVKKLFEALVTMAALIIGIVLLAFNFSLTSEVITAVGITMILLALPTVLLLYFSMNLKAGQRMLKLVSKLSAIIRRKHENGPEFESKLQKALVDFHEGMALCRTNPRAMIRPVVYQVIAWGFDILTLFIIFASIGHIVGLDAIVVTNTVGFSLQSQGFALAGVAPVVSSALYSTLGIQSLISISSSILTLFPMFWFKVLLAFLAFQVVVLGRSAPIFGKKKIALQEAQPALLP